MARYWEKRSIDLEKLIQEKNDKTIIKVNRYYENIFKELNAQIGKIFSTYATEGQMTIEDALKLLNTQQTKEVYNTLKRIYDRTDNEEIKQDILNRLNAPAYAARIARIEAMRDLIYSEAQNIGWATEMALQARMIDTYQTSFYQTHYTIQKGTGLAYDFNKLSNPAVKAAIANEWKGANYSKRIWNNTDKLANDLEDIITQGLMIGISGKKMATRIVKKIDSGRYEANRLIRTEVNYIAGQARLKCYEDIGTEKYIFIATLDTRTSVKCQKLDKTIHLVKDAEVGVNYPPMHPNCRSVDSAYIEGKDYSKLKRRARNPITGKTELVPANMNYSEWKKKYIDLKNDSEYQNAKVRAGVKNIEKLHSSDIMKSKVTSGALTDNNDPLYEKRNRHANSYYDSVRNSKKNNIINTIASNTGMAESDISKIYDHVFINEYELYGGKRRFDPDYDMAESFRRLREGKEIQEHDLILLRHERLEYELMNKEGMTYQEAHSIAETKYNYRKALDEFKHKNSLL